MTWFTIETKPGRLMAEAESLEAARRAASLLVEEEGEAMFVFVRPEERFALGYATSGPHGPIWHSTTLSRKYER